MYRFMIGLKKELQLSLATIMFHAIALLSPLLFLFIWTVTLDQDITLPTTVDPDSMNTKIVNFIKSYRSPRDIPYSRILKAGIAQEEFSTEELALLDTIVVRKDISIDQGIHGEIDLILNNINANLTKNYRNRLTGAITKYIEDNYLSGRAVSIREFPYYQKDVLWRHFFSMTLMGLAVFFSALMYGALSFTTEWSSRGMMALALSTQSSFWIIGGKLLAGWIKGTVALAAYFFIASGLNPGMTPEPMVLLGTLFLFYTAVFFTGMIFGLQFKEPITCFVLVLVCSIVLWVFSGGFGSSLLMAPWLKTLIRFLPSFHGFKLLEYAFFGGPYPEGAFLILAASVLVAGGVLAFSYHRVISSGKGIPA